MSTGARVVVEFRVRPGMDATFLFDRSAPNKIICAGSGSTRVVASESYPVIPEEYRFVASDSDE